MLRAADVERITRDGRCGADAFAQLVHRRHVERVAANGHIYTVNESGKFTVLRAGDTLDVAAVNELGESVRPTPAIAGDTLYVRSAEHLWAFGEKQPPKR
jgi:glycine/serine hydroxymethyltransferase